MPTALSEDYRRIRARSLALCETLEIEDYGLQATPFVSPPKWHLAHTTWFFETFILAEVLDGYRAVNPHYAVLFNSYYNGIGQQFPRPERGLLSRPTLNEVFAYRAQVDEAMLALLEASPGPSTKLIVERVTLGLAHEQQHQELILTDLKFSFSRNPLLPALRDWPTEHTETPPPALRFYDFPEGRQHFGVPPDSDGFHFDNESPQHPQIVGNFALANRLVTNGEYLAFIESRGYEDPRHWLSDGWATVQSERWNAPLHWHQREDAWFEYTLHGVRPLSVHAPVCHVSFFEADAFARWRGYRLPTEYEWEACAGSLPIEGQFANDNCFHPRSASSGADFLQLFGTCWEWTQSAYLPYPGFRTAPGAVGEYNGKFMNGQRVLRGGSCATDATHIRSTYRNFFYPQDRWQFSGIRLADDRK